MPKRKVEDVDALDGLHAFFNLPGLQSLGADVGLVVHRISASTQDAAGELLGRVAAELRKALAVQLEAGNCVVATSDVWDIGCAHGAGCECEPRL